MHVWLWTLASVALVSVASLAGALALSLDEARVRRLSVVLVSFAVGALLGDAFLHLIPEALERRGAGVAPGLLVLAGILVFFVVEKLLRHHHGPLHRHHHPDHAADHPALITINLVGDGVHNLIDGMLIAGGYLVSPSLGISTTAAVLLHEIPQELGDFGVLVHAGLSPRRALLWNAATALVSVVGAVITLLAGTRMGPALTDTLIPITAGGFVYIALADLVPELQHDRSLAGLAVQAALIAAGVAVMAALKAWGG